MSDDITVVLEAAFRSRVDELHKETRERVRETLHPGDRRTVRIGDREIGAVRVNKATTGWKVKDRDAFIAWVAEHHPAAVIALPQVVPAWEREFLKNPIDTTGEIPPGVEESESTPSLVITPNEAAAEIAQQILGAGLRELES